MELGSEMVDTYNLSADQRRFYEDNGYLVIKKLIDFTCLYGCKQRFIKICKGVVDRGGMTIVKEPSLAAQGAKGEDLINKISEIHFDDVFATYTEHPRLLHVLAQLIGEPMRVINSMLINKPPGSVRHPPHQDLYYFPFRPAEKITAAWTAIDDVTVENGCLYVIPGSHKRNFIYPHGNLPDSNKLYHGILEPAVSEEPRAQLEMSPGDTVLFHPLIVHGSGPNTTKGYRKALTAHYAHEGCHYVDARDSVQQPIVLEIEAESRRRGFQLSFEDVWRYKSKPIPSRGLQSKL
ncbi:probable phytanoyl-CoA dioxygenase isoform X1 [Bicyclus anynana]|nr:probable phytanoyl-CoA dioxygenase isoform X1 [Bicyclus anynana]XP_052744042.1 probable phytanoyl-CoA dioxygenase isoform X1 [Bicyclus anynana]XP_052744045.1 probable phytanoyl-CoA dioxygenase isoform X1 [Bicyclus anynana]